MRRAKVESIRHQAKYLLFHARGGAMALGVRRHQVRQLRDGRYVSVGRIHSLRTADEYLRVLTQYGEWCAATFGEKRLTVSLTHADWGAAWLADLAAAGRSPSTRKSYLCALVKAVEIRFAGEADVDRKLAAWRRLYDGLPRRHAPGNRAWTDQEEAALIRHVTARSADLGLALRVVQATGARVGELLAHPGHATNAARAGQVRADGTLELIGKGGAHRVAVLPEDLAAELRARAAGRDPAARLFDAVTSRQLYQALDEACQDLGLRHDGPHAFRYGFAQRQYLAERAAGAGEIAALTAVSRLLGHHRAEITRRYLGLAPDASVPSRPA